MARINFNPEQTRPFSGSTPVYPSGDYLVEIVDETEHDFRSGAGRGLTFDYRILSGEFSGGILRDNFNLWHTSPQAVEIAQRRLVSIAQAVGIQNFMDTRELHRKPFVVRISKSSYNGSERNQVDAYLSASSSPATATAPSGYVPPTNESGAPAPISTVPVAPSSTSTPFWS